MFSFRLQVSGEEVRDAIFRGYISDFRCGYRRVLEADKGSNKGRFRFPRHNPKGRLHLSSFRFFYSRNGGRAIKPEKKVG